MQQPPVKRIGIVPRGKLPALEADVESAYRQAIDRFAAAGSTITDVALPDLDEARTVALLVQMPEALSYHRRHLVEKAALYGADVRAGFAVGQFMLAEHYVTAKRMVERYRRQMDAIFCQIDAVLIPTCPIVAPKIGLTTVTLGGHELAVGNALTRFTSLFNLTGHPAISVPCGRSREGLPIGLQIVGRPFEESTILKLAHDHEQASGPAS